MLATLRRAGRAVPAHPRRAGGQHDGDLGCGRPSGSTGWSQKGLVKRSVSDADGRGREIALTPKGRRLTDEVVVRHWANEDRLLAALDPDEREQLAGLLRKLLLDVEGPAPGRSTRSRARAAS